MNDHLKNKIIDLQWVYHVLSDRLVWVSVNDANKWTKCIMTDLDWGKPVRFLVNKVQIYDTKFKNESSSNWFTVGRCL